MIQFIPFLRNDIRVQKAENKPYTSSPFRLRNPNTGNQISFGGISQILATPGIHCPYCGKVMITTVESKIFGSLAAFAKGEELQKLLLSIGEGQKYTQEKRFARYFAAESKKYPEQTLQEILKTLTPKANEHLSKVQYEIFKKAVTGKAFKKLSYKNQKIVSENIQKALNIISVNITEGESFSRKKLIGSFIKLRDDKSNIAEVGHFKEIINILTELPTSGNNKHSFIVKYQRRSSKTIAERLLRPYVASADHLETAEAGGTWKATNLLATHGMCNWWDREGHEEFEIFVARKPRISTHIIKNLGDVSRKIISGEITNMPDYIHGVMKTLYEKSGKRLVYNLDQIIDSIAPQKNLPVRNKPVRMKKETPVVVSRPVVPEDVFLPPPISQEEQQFRNSHVRLIAKVKKLAKNKLSNIYQSIISNDLETIRKAVYNKEPLKKEEILSPVIEVPEEANKNYKSILMATIKTLSDLEGKVQISDELVQRFRKLKQVAIPEVNSQKVNNATVPDDKKILQIVFERNDITPQKKLEMVQSIFFEKAIAYTTYLKNGKTKDTVIEGLNRAKTNILEQGKNSNEEKKAFIKGAFTTEDDPHNIITLKKIIRVLIKMPDSLQEIESKEKIQAIQDSLYNNFRTRKESSVKTTKKVVDQKPRNVFAEKAAQNYVVLMKTIRENLTELYQKSDLTPQQKLEKAQHIYFETAENLANSVKRDETRIKIQQNISSAKEAITGKQQEGALKKTKILNYLTAVSEEETNEDNLLVMSQIIRTLSKMPTNSEKFEIKEKLTPFQEAKEPLKADSLLKKSPKMQLRLLPGVTDLSSQEKLEKAQHIYFEMIETELASLEEGEIKFGIQKRLTEVKKVIIGEKKHKPEKSELIELIQTSTKKEENALEILENLVKKHEKEASTEDLHIRKKKKDLTALNQMTEILIKMPTSSRVFESKESELLESDIISEKTAEILRKVGKDRKQLRLLLKNDDIAPDEKLYIKQFMFFETIVTSASFLKKGETKNSVMRTLYQTKKNIFNKKQSPELEKRKASESLEKISKEETNKHNLVVLGDLARVLKDLPVSEKEFIQNTTPFPQIKKVGPFDEAINKITNKLKKSDVKSQLLELLNNMKIFSEENPTTFNKDNLLNAIAITAKKETISKNSKNLREIIENLSNSLNDKEILVA